ncbi:uncharacterized protein VP01_475g3 [Puccinia sorghi]|uniref:Uncharacterized protein n=1 Tax=Puccinia sorghi TaxID=27349 RepID=A0A0L6UPQ9_9BASI|nr:uncharacterized protein VP01_475g3 [Puccinia sorghi]
MPSAAAAASETRCNPSPINSPQRAEKQGEGRQLVMDWLRSEWLATVGQLAKGETMVKTIISQLQVSRINNKIPPSKWLSKMDHGKAISNTFQRPVVFLPVEESLSFIPPTTADY